MVLKLQAGSTCCPAGTCCTYSNYYWSDCQPSTACAGRCPSISSNDLLLVICKSLTFSDVDRWTFSRAHETADQSSLAITQHCSVQSSDIISFWGNFLGSQSGPVQLAQQPSAHCRPNHLPLQQTSLRNSFQLTDCGAKLISFKSAYFFSIPCCIFQESDCPAHYYSDCRSHRIAD